MCERKLETEQRPQHIDLPSPSGHRRVLFSFSWAAQMRAWGPTLSGTCSHSSIFSPTGLVSKLTDFLSSPSYIIVQLPTQYLSITGHRDVSLPLSLEWRVWLLSSGNNCHAVHSHSLPVHQSMTVQRVFTSSHIVSQTHLRQWSIHFRHLWNGMFGGVEAQFTTKVPVM